MSAEIGFFGVVLLFDFGKKKEHKGTQRNTKKTKKMSDLEDIEDAFHGDV